MCSDKYSGGLCHRAVAALKLFVLMEVRIVLTVWPVLLVMIAGFLALVLFAQPLLTSIPVWAVALGGVAVALLTAEIAEWLEDHSSWYSRIVYTGEILK